MEPLERNERVCEGYPDMDARLVDDLGLRFIYRIKGQRKLRMIVHVRY